MEGATFFDYMITHASLPGFWCNLLPLQGFFCLVKYTTLTVSKGERPCTRVHFAAAGTWSCLLCISETSEVCNIDGISWTEGLL